MICISRFLIPTMNLLQQAERVKGSEIKYTGIIFTKIDNRQAKARRFCYVRRDDMEDNMILSDAIEQLIVENHETGEKFAVITHEDVITASDNIVVRLKPRTN